jgi:hypothetical protein
MKRPDINLSSIVSDGPRYLPVSDGSVYTHATPCPVCDGTIEAGEFISKIGDETYGARWAHKDCAEKAFNAASIRGAWVMLGADAARRPRAYKAKELTVILEHLVQIAHRDEYDEEFDDQPAGRVYSTAEAAALIHAAAEGGDIAIM